MPTAQGEPGGIMEGNHLKAISKTDEEIRVANYMVLWGGKDLSGEYFTPKTEFESNYTKTGMLYVDWEHGLDYADPESPQRDDILGYVDWKTAAKDDKGLWVERVLSRRNEYMQYVEALIEEGLIGTSSEAVGGKVRKRADGEIQMWPLKRDAMTVQPMEPRMMSENAITAIKALSEIQPNLKALLQGQEMPDDGATVEAETEGKSTIIEIPKGNGGTKEMSDNITLTDEQFKALMERDKPPEEPKEEIPAWGKALTESVEAFTEFITNSSKLKDAGYVSPDSETDKGDQKSFGDFLVAVRNGNVKRINSVYKTALAEGAGATGGYGVPTEYGQVLLEMAKDYNALRRAGATTTTLSGRSKQYPVLDIETAPTAGDSPYAGGVVADWTEEAASINESEPRFRMVELILHKLATYTLASAEVREDFQESLDGIIARAFAKAIGSSEEYAFFRGDGVGKPLGILSSGALISAARSAASTVALADLAQMISDFMPDSWSRGVWFIQPAVMDQIIQLVSSPLSWINNMREGWQQPTLMGYPLYPVDALPALNTAGDILLVDPSYYLIGDGSEGLRIAFSEHYKFVNDQLTWKVTKRVDGQPLVDNVIYAEDGATTFSPFVALAAG